MSIEKVETEPEIYTPPRHDDGGDGAANWFTTMGNVELDDDPIEFAEGKIGIKTTLTEIYKNEEAREFVSKLMGGFRPSTGHPM